MGFFSELAQTLGADLGQDLLNRTGEFINQIAPLFQAAFGEHKQAGLSEVRASPKAT